MRALASVQEPAWAPTQHLVVRPPRLLSPRSVLSAHVRVDPDMCWARCHVRWELRASQGPDTARRVPNPTEKAALMTMNMPCAEAVGARGAGEPRRKPPLDALLTDGVREDTHILGDCAGEGVHVPW